MHQSIINHTIPPTDDEIHAYDRCHYYEYSNFTDGVQRRKVKCSKWVYDTDTFHETFTSKVCAMYSNVLLIFFCCAMYSNVLLIFFCCAIYSNGLLIFFCCAMYSDVLLIFFCCAMYSNVLLKLYIGCFNCLLLKQYQYKMTSPKLLSSATLQDECNRYN